MIEFNKWELDERGYYKHYYTHNLEEELNSPNWEKCPIGLIPMDTSGFKFTE